jgi:sulfotransferase family protein
MESRANNIRLPVGFGQSDDRILQDAFRLYVDEQSAVPELLEQKLRIARHYDVPGMERAVSVCFWGRSGSFLLLSFLDSHEDAITLPMNASQSLNPFFSDFASLSVWEKLIAYPAYSESQLLSEGTFLRGEYSTPATDYYAAVHSLFLIYGDQPSCWLNSRKCFFQLFYAAYAIANGRLPATPRPLIVHSQHWVSDELARCFIDDFPSGQFIHTIRDPISSLDSWFDRVQDFYSSGPTYRPEVAKEHMNSVVFTLSTLLCSDRSHLGMEARSCAIRFEDLHLATEATMRRLAEWLGISYYPSLLSSTFNGIPYVNEIRGISWVGANPSNTERRSKNLSVPDQAMCFALLQENFLSWNYPSPAMFRRKWIRLGTIALLLFMPLKIEILNARTVAGRLAVPALRQGRIAFACAVLWFLILRRVRVIWLIAAEAKSRLTGKRKVLELL